MLQFWMLVSKFYLRSLLSVDLSFFCLAKKVVVVRMAVTVGYHTGTLRLYLGLQFQHVVLKITNERCSTNSAVDKMLPPQCNARDLSAGPATHCFGQSRIATEK